MNTLKAEKRTMKVKAKRLRREGYVIGNVFGRDIEQSIPIQIEKAEAEQLVKKSGKGSRLILDIEGETKTVLIKEVVFNAMKKRIDEMDFQTLIADEKVHSVAEIVLVNHEKLTAGVLQQQLEEIPYTAYPSELVEKVEIDVSELRVGDSIKVKDLPMAFNPEISLHIDEEATIVVLTESHNAGATEEEETGEQTE